MKGIGIRSHMIPLTPGAGRFAMIHPYGADIDRKAARNDAVLLAKVRQAGAIRFA